MKEPTKRNQQVLWYLYHWNEFSLLEVISHSRFHKFQTRLSEIEKIHGTLANRRIKRYITPFGKKDFYFLYKSINKKKLLDLYDKV